MSPLGRHPLGGPDQHVTLLPGNVIPAQFDGRVLHPDPPVLRQLSVYTRVRPDPITEAFVDGITKEALLTSSQ